MATAEVTPTTCRYVIKGGRSLRGDYPIQGNKNAVLPLIAASLLSPHPVTLRRVPQIRDVANLVALVKSLGAEVALSGDSLMIDGSRLSDDVDLPADLIRQLRGGILLLGALAARHDRILCASPGGCSIGRRSFDAHWRVFEAAGFSVEEKFGTIDIRRERTVARPSVFLPESSVTATENALILFAALGRGRIENPAREPHVLSLIDFLREIGCTIETHALSYEVRGGVKSASRPVSFDVPGDYIDAGTLAIAAAATGGEVCLHGISAGDLMGVRPFLEDFGVVFRAEGPTTFRVSGGVLRNRPQLTAGPWPLFPTDLISLAIVLAVQGDGLSLVHDWMYEARMFFVDKLVRMGAVITLCDPHRVLVQGTGRLRGIRLESPDIRAGMALVVAGLCAEGETIIEHAEVIRRGYERVTERLSGLGAEISEG